ERERERERERGSPPGEISSGQQVQSQGSPAAALYLLASHCWSNKPEHCEKLQSDIRSSKVLLTLSL
uniref:Uncharacterized protein n=1 Tax=Seriola dumerili TaxID=41447 RepID=A0A3B4UKN6_SERDU